MKTKRSVSVILGLILLAAGIFLIIYANSATLKISEVKGQVESTKKLFSPTDNPFGKITTNKVGKELDARVSQYDKTVSLMHTYGITLIIIATIVLILATYKIVIIYIKKKK